MLINAATNREEIDIPKRCKFEWDRYTKGITKIEKEAIIDWINDKFDKVALKNVKVQPAGWLGSGFNWANTPLLPIYRECCTLMKQADDEKKMEKAGQLFGLFVVVTLIEHRDHEKWYFVKDEKYESRGVPIRSRIYFLR